MNFDVFTLCKDKGRFNSRHDTNFSFSYAKRNFTKLPLEYRIHSCVYERVNCVRDGKQETCRGAQHFFETVANTVQMTVQIYSDQQAPSWEFYKICDFSLTSGFFVKSLRNLRFFTHLCNANHTSASLQILQNLRFFAINIRQKDR